MTEFHSLNTPPEGSENWDEPLNTNFRVIDQKLPIVDLETNKGSYTPKEDSTFLASDTGALFVGDGTSWVELPDSGPISLADDEAITFGSDDDYSAEYDSANGYLQVRDEAGGVDSLRFTGTGDISIPNGVLTVSGGAIHASGGDVESGDTNGALEVDERTSVADTGKVALSRDADAHGYAMIQDTTNTESILVYLDGSNGSVEIIHQSDTAVWSTTEDNDTTTNVYWDATNARYELNNETGGAVTYAVELLKA